MNSPVISLWLASGLRNVSLTGGMTDHVNSIEGRYYGEAGLSVIWVDLKKDDFSTLTKNIMREKDDPDHPGEKIAWIEKQTITYLTIRQQKTGAKVSIPCNSKLKAILEKYDYQLPHMLDQVINRNIKEVAKKAGLTELVEIETTRGGTPKKEMVEKYKLVHTHTARRTGATLMYLAGIDIYDIMKVTGHSSPKMLKKYIKADSLEVVQKLTDKYDYFK